MKFGFTLNQLKKRIDKLVGDGHGRRRVCISKTTFRHNCEGDGVTILEVHGLGLVRVPQADGDGGININKDDSESSRLCVVLAGSSGANSKGDLVEDFRQ